MNAFIANKRSRRDTRFGFVKVTNKKGVSTAIEKINERNVYGNKILMVIAKINSKPYTGERFLNSTGKVSMNDKKVHKGLCEESRWERGELSEKYNPEENQKDIFKYNDKGGRMRIYGHVETEDFMEDEKISEEVDCECFWCESSLEVTNHSFVCYRFILVKDGRVGFGGVLCSALNIIRGIFLGSKIGYDSNLAVLFVIKSALELFGTIKWVGGMKLLVEVIFGTI
ncbi:hypothetical protein GQ457_08G027130 [Hibiscus cannabinus]